MSVEDLTLSVEEGELAGVAEPELKPNAMGFAVPAAGSAESPRPCAERLRRLCRFESRLLVSSSNGGKRKTLSNKGKVIILRSRRPHAWWKARIRGRRLVSGEARRSTMRLPVITTRGASAGERECTGEKSRELVRAGGLKKPTAFEFHSFRV